MKGTAGFSFAEEVEVYFTNSKTYTGNDGIVAKYLDMSASKSIVLAPGVTSAVAYDNTTGTWTDVAPAVTGVPLALAMRPARITEIATLDDLFAYDPALDVNAGPIVLSMFKLAVPIVGSALAAWIAGRVGYR